MRFTGLFRRPRLLPLALMVGAAVFVGTLSQAGQAQAAVATFEVQMLGANEVPAASGPGSGFARFTFDDQTRQLTYAVWLSGMSSNQVTASHIHRAAPGVAGPAIYTLASAPFDSISGTITLTEADVADLRAGNFYVNIHSIANPSGFARGQLRLPAAAPAATAPSPAVRPPSAGDAGLAAPTSGDAWQALLIAGIGLALGVGFAARAARRS